MLTEQWKKSQRSGHNGSCVEARRLADGGVEVRNSNNVAAGSVAFTETEWNVFVLGVKDNEFDLA